MLWIVGKANVDAPGEWEFQGVFDSEKKAVAACATQRDGTVDMFVGPAKLNVSVTRRKRSWPGAYYPATPSKRRSK